MTGSILHNRKEVLFTTLWDTFHSIVYFNLYSIFNSRKLMTYLFWYPTKTINFLKIWLMILNLLVLMLKVSVLTFPLKVMVFSQNSLPSWQVQSVKYEHSLTMLLHCPCLCCHSCFWQCMVFLGEWLCSSVFFIVCLYLHCPLSKRVRFEISFTG